VTSNPENMTTKGSSVPDSRPPSFRASSVGTPSPRVRPFRIGGAALLAIVAATGSAAAQAPATPGTANVAAPAVTDTGATPPAAPAPEATPNLTELQNRIDAAEQASRIAVRRVELLEEQLAATAQAAKQQKDVPTFTTAGERGFNFRSGDGLYLLRVKGQLQIDTRWFLNDGALSDKADTFLIRRMRPSIDGTVFGLVDYKFTPDFAGASLAVFDAYADIHPFQWLRLRAGKFKSPLGLERLQNDPDLVFMERALTQDLTPQRDVGAALGGEVGNGILTYSLGVYNGAPDSANPDVDTNHAKDFVGRVLLQPFKAEALSGLGSLGLHFAASTGNRFGTPTNTLLPAYKSGGQNTFFNYISGTTDPAGTPFAHLRQTRINPGLYYYFGGFGVLGEYVWDKQEVQKGNVTTNLVNWAAHGTASFVIGGKNGYDGATPNQVLDFTKGTWGALEIGVRWNYLKVDGATFGSTTDTTALVFADNTKSPAKVQAFGGAINYVPSRTFRLCVNFEQSRFTGGSSVKTTTTDATGAKVTTATVTNRHTENALLGRVQVNF